MALTAKQKRDAREQSLRDEGAAQARAEMLGANADVRGEVSAETAAINKAATLAPGHVASAHGDIARVQVAGGKVTVGCKLGIAFYDIQLCEMVTKFQQNMQGGQDIREAERIGPVVRLRGTAYPRGTPPKGFYSPPEIVDGAALTRNVDKAWFDAWLEQNRRNPMVMNHMIFAAEHDDAVRGLARDFKDLHSGLDPIDPSSKNDPRMLKSTRVGTGEIPEVSDIQSGQR